MGRPGHRARHVIPREVPGAGRAGPMLSGLVAALLTLPAAAQQAGWHYSPLPDEGDRAAMGCGYGADREEHTCLVVRCEDDFTIGLHIHTTRPEGDAGPWRLDIDKESYPLRAESTPGSPYRARVAGDVSALLDGLKHGAIAYLDPLAGGQVSRNGISLEGSLQAIGRALYYCAPRTRPPAEGTEVPPGP